MAIPPHVEDRTSCPDQDQKWEISEKQTINPKTRKIVT